MAEPGENADSGGVPADAAALGTELKRLRRAGLADLALRPHRYTALTALLAATGTPQHRDVLARLESNEARFRAALQRLPSEAMRRAASILFHVGSPGRLPALEDRRRAADRAYTGRNYAREPDTIQRHLERDLLDPLIVEALRSLGEHGTVERPAEARSSWDGSQTPGNELERAISGLERRDFYGAVVALDAWLSEAHRTDHVEAGSAVVPQDSPVDRMNRRALLRNLSAVGTLAILNPTDFRTVPGMPEWTRARRRRVFDGSALEDLADINTRLWQVFAASQSKRDALALVRYQLDVLIEGLEGSQREAVHKRLCSLLGELLQLAGEIFFDLEQYAEAANCYTVAASVSKEAKAFDLWSCAVTRHAFIGVYEERFIDAIPMLELAAYVAKNGDSKLSTRHWVDAVAAQAFAGVRDANACEKAMESAAAVQGMKGQIHNGGWLRFDGLRLHEERGSCYVQLGRTDNAESSLLAALNSTLSTRRRGNVLTDLALVGIQRRDSESVVSFGTEALSIARQTSSGVVGHRLQALQGRLKPMLDNPAIKHLSDGISEFRSSTLAT